MVYLTQKSRFLRYDVIRINERYQKHGKYLRKNSSNILTVIRITCCLKTFYLILSIRLNFKRS